MKTKSTQYVQELKFLFSILRASIKNISKLFLASLKHLVN